MTIQDFAQTIEKRVRRRHVCQGVGFKHYVPVLWMTGHLLSGIFVAISWQTVPDRDFYTIATRWFETTQGCHFFLAK